MPRPAGAALTATLPAPATLAAEDELTLAPAAPIASKLREINARLVRRVTSELRAYHEARGGLPPRRNGAGLDHDGAESAARRALRNCCALGQGHLAVEVYEAYRAAALRPLSPEVAAEVIGRLGDMWERPSAESPARWAAAHAERRAADDADGAFAPADGLELALLVESHLRADSGAARGAPPPPLVVGALVRTRRSATSAAPSSCTEPRAARWATSRSRRSSKPSSHRTAVARPSPSGATAPPAGSACPGARSFR